MTTRVNTRAVVLPFALAVTLVASACSSGSGDSADGELTPVTVMAVPTMSMAPVYVGADQGFFEDVGLDVTIEPATDLNAITAAITSGSAQFGSGGLAAQLLAIGKNVPVKVVGAQSATPRPETPETPTADGMIYVAEDSPIQSVADLEGRTVAVNGLVSNAAAVLNATLDNNGVDPSSVDLVQVNFPEQIAALEQGQADAIVTAEPTSTAAKNAGMRLLVSSYPFPEGGVDTHIISSWFTAAQTVEQDPDLVKSFREGLAQSQQYATDNPDAVRSAVTEFAAIPEEAAAEVVLPTYPDTTDPAIITAEIELAQKYLGMEGEFTAEEVMAPE